MINIPLEFCRALFGGILAAGGVFATSHDPVTAVGALVATMAVGGVLGAHLTASIGEQTHTQSL